MALRLKMQMNILLLKRPSQNPSSLCYDIDITINDILKIRNAYMHACNNIRREIDRLSEREVESKELPWHARKQALDVEPDTEAPRGELLVQVQRIALIAGNSGRHIHVAIT